MKSILINPKDEEEFELISNLLIKMNIPANVLSNEEKEDLGLGILMKEADRTQKVSRESILEKIKTL